MLLRCNFTRLMLVAKGSPGALGSQDPRLEDEIVSSPTAESDSAECLAYMVL